MSFKVYLGDVDKKINSTLQAPYETWPSYDAVWKHDKDLVNPTVTILSPPTGGYPKWNCMYIDVANAWYWVTSLVSVRHNVWEVSGIIDGLATYKEEIMNTSCYIEYGFNTDASGNEMRLADNRQNIAMNPTMQEWNFGVLDSILQVRPGTYILSAVGSRGSITTYKLTKSDLKTLINKIGTDITDVIGEMTDIVEVFKYFTTNNLAQGNAIAAIKNCVWLPVKYAEVPSYTTSVYSEIYLGDFATGVIAEEVRDGGILYHDYTLKWKWPVDDWKRLNCQIMIYLPWVGNVVVPAEQCNFREEVTITYAIECIQGGMTAQVRAGEQVLYTGTSNIGVPYCIGSSNIPLQSFVSGSMQAVGGVIQAGTGVISGLASLVGLAAGIPGGASPSSVVSSVGSGLTNVAQGTMQSLTPAVQSTGGIGGSSALGLEVKGRFCLLYYDPIDDAGFQAVYGHPVMRVAKPLPGYCQTRGFSLASTARMDVAAKVNAMMDGGVFIE